jgi:O-antigen/teichoic acid export membrane protein
MRESDAPRPAADTADPLGHAVVVEDVTASVSSVGKQARSGVRWSLVGQAVGKVGSFAMNLILARLLMPEDFGVYAIALSAVSLLMMIDDIGIIGASMQWRGDFQQIVPTASIIACVASVLIFTGSFVAAPHFAALAGTPSATPLIRLIIVAVLVDGVIAVRTASLLRDFRQSRLVVASLCGLLTQLVVGISLAVAGHGPLSLAAAYLASYFVMGVLILRFAKLPFRLSFDPVVAKRLLRFGLPLTVGLGLEAALLNADYIVVGRTLGAAAVGLYLLAFNVSSWIPNVILSAVRWVAVPSFARLAEDKEALASAVQRSIALLVMLMLPVTVCLIVLAPELIGFLYGSRWVPAAPALQFLAVLSVIRLVTSLPGDVLSGVGRTPIAMWVTVGWAVALVPALVVGTRMAGIRGTGIAHVVVGLGVAVPLAMLAVRHIGVPLRPLARALVRPLTAALVAAAIGEVLAALLSGSTVAQLALAGTGIMLSYLLVGFPWRDIRTWAVHGSTMMTSRLRGRSA